MQIGTRWKVGQSPPSGLPQPLLDAISATEAAQIIAPTTSSVTHLWTLTWMERRPICTLDSGVVLTIGVDGEVHRSDGETTDDVNPYLPGDNDDWLSS